MQTIQSTLESVRGRGNPVEGRGKDAAPKPETEHIETQRNAAQDNATRPIGQQAMKKVDEALSQHQSTSQRKALPTGRQEPAAETDDQARPEKPAFTRGISVIDQTAVTSSAPTPAGEIQNPMSFGVGKSISRQRESHLPDEDLREQVRAMKRGEQLDELEGDDEFGEDLSRQETAKRR